MSAPPGGTAYNSVTVAGAWRQKNVGSSKVLTRRTRQTTPGTPFETAWTIAGSNDQVTWYLVDRKEGQDTSAGVDGYGTYSGAYSYQYYRYIVEQMSESTTSIMNGVFGWYDDSVYVYLSTGGGYTQSESPGDVGSPQSGGFYVKDNPNDPSFQTTSNYNTTGVYTGSTTTIIYDPFSPIPASEPTNLIQIPGVNSRRLVSISFTLPASNGGSEIVGYEYNIPSDPQYSSYFAPVTDNNGTGNTGTIDAYGDGRKVNVAIRAVTANAGRGPISNYAYVQAGILGPTTITEVSPGNGAVILTFSNPDPFIIDVDGNVTGIAGYFYSIDGGSTYQGLNPQTTTSPITISNLTKGQTYNIAIKALNRYGQGFPSNIVSATSLGSAPSAPTGLNASVGNQSVTISFTPGYNNGSAITSYQYSTDNGVNYTSTSVITSPITITTNSNGQPLTNGQSYQIVLRAVNADGEGTASSSITAIPSTIPDAPTINSITVVDKTATVSFTAPISDGSSAITNYKYSTNGSTYISAGTTSPFTISNLDYGQTYQITLRAVNNRGDGIVSSASPAVIPAIAPGAPTINFITVGNKTATIAFTLGLINGSAITGHRYSTDNGVNYTNTAVTISPITISNLLNGQTYQIKLISINGIGESVASNMQSAVLPALAPDAPTITSISTGNKTATIAFTLGLTNGSAITGHRYSTDNGVNYINTPVTTSPITISSLLNGQTYQIKLISINGIGESVASNMQSAVLPALAPDAPINLSASLTSTSATISFTPGLNNGDSIINYKYSTDGVNYFNANTTSSPITITGLISEQSYTIRLLAVNNYGNGSVSTITTTTYSTSLPSAPTGLTVVSVGNQTATISFTPGSNNGNPITNYKYSKNGTDYFSAATASSPITISGLTNGVTYQITLLAVNQNGDSIASNEVAATSIPVIPSAPTGLTATVVNQTATISFTPGSNGGSTIIRYEYSKDRGTNYTDAGTTTSPITISDLINGVTYQIKLRAVNSIGNGVASASIPVTSIGIPAAPTDLVATARNTRVILFFKPGSNGGSTIINYKYSIDNGLTYNEFSTPITISPVTITGLNNNQNYQIKLRAVSSLGDGAESSMVSATPVTTVPDAPINLSAIRGSGTQAGRSNIFNWSLLSDGGSGVTSYQYSIDDGVSWTAYGSAFATRNITFNSALIGTFLNTRIRAINALGAGPPSNRVISTPGGASTPPSPPVILSASGTGTTATIFFTPGSSGSSAITNYIYSIDNGITYTTLSPASTTSPITITGLTVNQIYYFALFARSNNGDSSPTSLSVLTVPKVIPDAPTSLSTTVGNKRITVAFTPGSDNGSDITDYQYSIDTGVNYFSAFTTTSPVIITVVNGQPLTNGQSYTILLRAVNNNGNGDVSTSVTATPSTIPDAPVITSIIIGDKSITVVFTSGSDNGRAIVNYKYSTDNGVNYTAFSTPITTSPVTITMNASGQLLTNGQSYTILLKAVNENGDGVASNSITAIPAAATPTAPSINSITVGNKTATVTFTAPSSDGGSAITKYLYSTNNGSTYSDTGTTSPFTISGLTNGQTYQIKLLAFNFVGNGTASSAVNAVLPALAPDAPTIDSVTVGNKTATVAFTLGPANGSAFTGLKYSTDNGVNYTNIAFTTSPFTISNLLNGQTYQIKLISVNNIDDSVASSAFPAVLPARAPDAPTELTATRGNASVTINFTPRSNNGAAIRKYQYSIDESITYQDVNSVNTASSVTISGLTNGLSYNIFLRAVNDIGDGVASTFVTATPSTAASAPSINSVTRGNNSLIVDFTAGSNGGNAISNYKYSVDGTNYYAFSPAVTTSPATISIVNGTSLVNGQTYTVTLLAVNTNGDGEVSNLLNGTPSSVPDAPTGLSATVGNTTATISFTPGFDQGSAILNYKYSTDGTTYYEFDPVVIVSPVTISGLVNDTSYNIRLLARNANGDGAVSDIVVATPTAVAPNPPTGLTRSYAGSGSVSIYFTAGSDGGSPITNYEYSINGGTSYVALNPPDITSPVTISGLTNGQSYTIQLRSVNLAGESTASSTVIFTPTATFTQNNPCFLEGSMITCYDPESKQEIERVIQTLRKGDLVKTTMDGYKAVEVIGTSKIYNPPNSMRSMHRLYRCPKENYPELKEDLVLTGCHAILVSELSDDERRDLLQLQGKIYATEDYYRLIACCDKRTIPYELDGFFNIWHLALENENCHFNYGIYANGLKVETSSIYVMKERSGMTLM
jgi:hypothetical protein